MIGTVFGGIGLFLLGMILMTEGLKAAAGGALQRTLSRLTGGAGGAFLSGMVSTALVQSSSATVVTTIGFVSAGLLTFTQAVGVVFGANLGTTSTGWIVSLLGFKVSVGAVALPLVGVGAFARLLGKGKWAAIGTAVAGFGVLFVGIDLLQTGMGAWADRIDPGRFPSGGIGGRLLMVGIGAGMTVIMQSSSAAVATTLTALHVGSVDLGQAAFLVIGQNIGTTVTAALATIGASIPARRTAVAHILFNVVAGAAAFVLAPLLLWSARPGGLLGPELDPTLALAGFHTAFNLMGVALLLPLAPRFARFVSGLVPERRPSLTRNLDPSVAELPAVATEAARLTIKGIGAALTDQVRAVVANGKGGPRRSEVEEAEAALAEVRTFLSTVRTPPEPTDEHRRRLEVLHAVDHLESLAESLPEAPGPELVERLAEALPMAGAREALDMASVWFTTRDGAPGERLRAHAEGLAEARREGRRAALARAARGEVAPDEALNLVDAMRWLDAAVYHVWRSVHHLEAWPSDPDPTHLPHRFPTPTGRDSR